MQTVEPLWRIAGGGVFAVLCGAAFATSTTIVHVSEKGNDRLNGLSVIIDGNSGPLATLGKAIEIVRTRKLGANPSEQFIIQLESGTYRLTDPLKLTQIDSGVGEMPFVIQGEDASKVRITGSVPLTKKLSALPDAVRRRLTPQAHEHVVAYDLKDNRISFWVGPQVHGFNAPAKEDPNELFVNGVPQTLAAWPKQGFAKITSLPDGGAGTRFKVDSDRPAKWESITNVWAFGYWAYDWSDSHIPVAERSSDGTIRMKRSPTAHGMGKGQRVRFENIPEELNAPGTWYFDYQSGIVYVWLDQPSKPNLVELSIAPTLFQLDSVSHLYLKNLTLDGARGDLVDANDVEDVFIERSHLIGAGRTAVKMDGVSSGIVYSEISNTGAGGIYLSGGDRKTLRPGNLIASHDIIHDFGRIYRSNEPGILLRGVGNHAEHNRIYNGVHQAIFFRGNDHVITYNDIHDVDLDTGDAGAIYCGRDWTERGNEIKFNYLHAIHGVGPLGATGIYVDDQGSGTLVKGNVLFDVHRGVLIGGGVDNVVEGNMFIKTDTSVYIDNRGMNWERDLTGNPRGYLQSALRAVPYQSEIYRNRYPTLANIISEGLGVPRRNSILGNLFVRSGPMDIRMPVEIISLQKLESNLTYDDPGFAEPIASAAPPASAFLLLSSSKALKAGFKQIPVNEIGP